jgi:peptidoglycan/xylan/chitin deacetylase (PgdA/CDA1 family)
MTATLIYHDVVPEPDADSAGFPGRLAGRYKHTPEAFEAHLDAIERTGVSVGLAGEGAGVVLTFDDGGASAADIAARLERRGWRGHFFMTTARIGTPAFATGDELRRIAAAGHDVGSHSHTHPTYMGRLSRTQLELEWQRSRDILGAVIGVAPGSASVPGGYLSDAVIETAAGAGFRLLMTSDPTSTPIQRGEMTVLGRYSIRATTSTEQAVRYASGDRRARARLVVEWRAKQLAKRVSPRLFEAARRRRPVRSARR